MWRQICGGSWKSSSRYLKVGRWWKSRSLEVWKPGSLPKVCSVDWGAQNYLVQRVRMLVRTLVLHLLDSQDTGTPYLVRLGWLLGSHGPVPAPTAAQRVCLLGPRTENKWRQTRSTEP